MEDTDLAKTAQAHAETSAAFAANMAKVAERSQEIWMHFIKANAEDEHPLHADPLNTLPAFQELTQTMLENPKELAEQIKILHAGGTPISPRAARQLIDQIQHPCPESSLRDYKLTPRETEILQ